MKKLLSAFLTTIFICATLSGCASSNEPATTVNIATLSGATCMGLVGFMDDVDQGNITDQDYQFSILTAPDEISTGMVMGTYDIATVPANLASVLFNNTNEQIQVLAINTLGVLYIVETGTEINSIGDLKGKTIYASGKGSTPEFALNYLLSENGLTIGEDVSIEWKSEQAECLAAIAADDSAIAMLPQPFATSAMKQNNSIRIALDLTAEWNTLQTPVDDPSMMITGVVIGRKEFIDDNPSVIKDFLAHYEDSVSFVNKNNDKAASLVGSYGIVTEEIAKTALPACNIVFINGEEMKTALSGYLRVLFEAEPKSIGGSLPTDSFYYINE